MVIIVEEEMASVVVVVIFEFAIVVACTRTGDCHTATCIGTLAGTMLVMM